jgi:hypothetical protein
LNSLVSYYKDDRSYIKFKLIYHARAAKIAIFYFL